MKTLAGDDAPEAELPGWEECGAGSSAPAAPTVPPKAQHQPTRVTASTKLTERTIHPGAGGERLQQSTDVPLLFEMASEDMFDAVSKSWPCELGA